MKKPQVCTDLYQTCIDLCRESYRLVSIYEGKAVELYRIKEKSYGITVAYHREATVLNRILVICV